MENDGKNQSTCCDHHWNHKKSWHGDRDGGCGAIYCFGIIGAAVFFIGKATTFWMGVLGFLKAIVWPAFLVYEALKLLVK